MGVNCPYCGQLTDRPALFSMTKQKIFNYIWDNPLCSKEDIEIAVYGRPQLSSNTVPSHLCKIRDALMHTAYQLVTNKRGKGCRYTIQMRKPAYKTLITGAPNASV